MFENFEYVSKIINKAIKLFVITSFLQMFNVSAILLQTVKGEVQKGNFTYWGLNFNGNLKLVLHTIKGDADLYVSSTLSKPTYNPNEYDLHSASCGEDIVEIPEVFNRPIGIGVYGHPHYENSTYLLEIYYNGVAEVSSENYPIIENTVKSRLKRVIFKTVTYKAWRLWLRTIGLMIVGCTCFLSNAPVLPVAIPNNLFQVLRYGLLH